MVKCDAGFDRISEAAKAAEAAVKPTFDRIDRVEAANTKRTLAAFAEYKISTSHLNGTTGYGYGDMGRDTLEQVYARVYGSQSALVRIQIVSGTHAISTALFGVLRPGDRVLCVTGKPYDTILPAIGEGGKKGEGSLRDFGISFDYMDFCDPLNTGEIKQTLSDKKYRMVYIQRSRGYTLRRSLQSGEISALCAEIREKFPETITFVDNCYGEFVNESEPCADLLAGSLIKNAGGGICPCGGYIAGNTELVEQCAARLFSVGPGREVGPSLGYNRELYTGLFLAPHVTAQNLKVAVFAAQLMSDLGYGVNPAAGAPRGDIVQLLELGSPANLTRFCAGIQAASPVDSYVTPEAWDMPGYDCKVIMAAGGFISGSSTEISADAPLREPYAVWLQGGLTYQSGKLAVINAARALQES